MSRRARDEWIRVSVVEGAEDRFRVIWSLDGKRYQNHATLMGDVLRFDVGRVPDAALVHVADGMALELAGGPEFRGQP